MLPYRGNGTWTIDGQKFDNPAGESVLFLPPAPLSLSNDITSGVLINLDPNLLLQTALTMAGPNKIACHLKSHLSQPKRLMLSEPGNRILIESIYHFLAELDRLYMSIPKAAAKINLDDALIRLIALLLIPELREETDDNPTGRETEGEEQILNRLTSWIDANHANPITLTELERISGYSRRSLQYHFRRRFNCSPMQYLKHRRLDVAYQRLRNPEPGDQVAQIGENSGFMHATSFSREFRTRFGITPSELLRNSRRG